MGEVWKFLQKGEKIPQYCKLYISRFIYKNQHVFAVRCKSRRAVNQGVESGESNSSDMRKPE